VRVTEAERFAASVEGCRSRRSYKSRRCCICDDDVYQEDMWRKAYYAGFHELRYWRYVCVTCMPTHEMAVVFFQGRKW